MVLPDGATLIHWSPRDAEGAALRLFNPSLLTLRHLLPDEHEAAFVAVARLPPTKGSCGPESGDRTRCTLSRVAACLLDTTLRCHAPPSLLPVRVPTAAMAARRNTSKDRMDRYYDTFAGPEDPRLFFARDGRILMSFGLNSENATRPSRRGLYVADLATLFPPLARLLGPTAHAESPWAAVPIELQYAGAFPRVEKNWMPFLLDDGSLRWSYALVPHIVLSLRDGGGAGNGAESGVVTAVVDDATDATRSIASASERALVDRLTRMPLHQSAPPARLPPCRASQRHSHSQPAPFCDRYLLLAHTHGKLPNPQRHRIEHYVSTFQPTPPFTLDAVAPIPRTVMDELVTACRTKHFVYISSMELLPPEQAAPTKEHASMRSTPRQRVLPLKVSSAGITTSLLPVEASALARRRVALHVGADELSSCVFVTSIGKLLHNLSAVDVEHSGAGRVRSRLGQHERQTTRVEVDERETVSLSAHGNAEDGRIGTGLEVAAAVEAMVTEATTAATAAVELAGGAIRGHCGVTTDQGNCSMGSRGVLLRGAHTLSECVEACNPHACPRCSWISWTSRWGGDCSWYTSCDELSNAPPFGDTHRSVRVHTPQPIKQLKAPERLSARSTAAWQAFTQALSTASPLIDASAHLALEQPITVAKVVNQSGAPLSVSRLINVSTFRLGRPHLPPPLQRIGQLLPLFAYNPSPIDDTSILIKLSPFSFCSTKVLTNLSTSAERANTLRRPYVGQRAVMWLDRLKLRDGVAGSIAPFSHDATLFDGRDAVVRARIAHAEDPRPVRLGGRLHVLFTRKGALERSNVSSGGEDAPHAATNRKQMWLAALEPSVRQVPLTWDHARGDEANWVPLGHAPPDTLPRDAASPDDDAQHGEASATPDLLVSYSLCPHVVLRCSATSGRCVEAFRTELVPGCAQAQAEGGAVLHHGTPFVASSNGTLLTIAHFKNVRGSKDAYKRNEPGWARTPWYTHVLVRAMATPPYALLDISPPFRFPAAFAPNGWSQRIDDVQFCSGLQFLPHRRSFLITWGAGDCAAFGALVPEKVLGQLP